MHVLVGELLVDKLVAGRPVDKLVAGRPVVAGRFAAAAAAAAEIAVMMTDWHWRDHFAAVGRRLVVEQRFAGLVVVVVVVVD